MTLRAFYPSMMLQTWSKSTQLREWLCGTQSGFLHELSMVPHSRRAVESGAVGRFGHLGIN